MSQDKSYEEALKRAKSLMGDNLFSEEDLARTLLQIADLTSERDRLAEALRGIVEIGKRDLTNPKYDAYFEAARAALDKDA